MGVLCCVAVKMKTSDNSTSQTYINSNYCKSKAKQINFL